LLPLKLPHWRYSGGRPTVSGMSGPVQLGPVDGRLILRTYREGVATRVGHDLVLETVVWSAVATPPGVAGGPALEVRVDLTSLRVLEGRGGVKPLSDRDKRDIVGTARKSLDTEHHAEAVYRSTGFTPTDAGGVFDGTLTLHGVDRPLRVAITRMAQGGYRAESTVRQTDHGIKPYTAFLGALKLRDTVEVEVQVNMQIESADAGAPSA
jgi:YceI-like domain